MIEKNPFSCKTIGNMKKTSKWKILYFKKIEKFQLPYFFMKSIFLFLILINLIENKKFNFLAILCNLRKN